MPPPMFELSEHFAAVRWNAGAQAIQLLAEAGLFPLLGRWVDEPCECLCPVREGLIASEPIVAAPGDDRAIRCHPPQHGTPSRLEVVNAQCLRCIAQSWIRCWAGGVAVGGAVQKKDSARDTAKSLQNEMEEAPTRIELVCEALQ